MQKTLPYQTKHIPVYHEWPRQVTHSHQGTQHFSKTFFLKNHPAMYFFLLFICGHFHLFYSCFAFCLCVRVFFLLAFPWGTNQNHFYPRFNTLLFIIVKYRALPAYSVMLLPKPSKQLATIKTLFFSCGQQLITDAEF